MARISLSISFSAELRFRSKELRGIRLPNNKDEKATITVKEDPRVDRVLITEAGGFIRAKRIDVTLQKKDGDRFVDLATGALSQSANKIYDPSSRDKLEIALQGDVSVKVGSLSTNDVLITGDEGKQNLELSGSNRNDLKVRLGDGDDYFSASGQFLETQTVWNVDMGAGNDTAETYGFSARSALQKSHKTPVIDGSTGHDSINIYPVDYDPRNDSFEIKSINFEEVISH